MTTQPAWTADNELLKPTRTNRLPIILAGAVVFGLVITLMVTAIRTNSQYYITVDEYYGNTRKYAQSDLRLASWVVQDSIVFTQLDATTSRLEFDVVDDLQNPGQMLRIVAINEPMPDLLQGEAQAIVEGQVGADGVMYANEGGLFFKCPTKYEEAESPAVQ